MAEDLLEEARAFLRGHTQGVLRFDEHTEHVRIVIGPQGRIIAPAMVAMLRSVDTVLFLPEESDEAMQVMVTIIQFDERGEHGHLADRWRIYHGEPPDVQWAFLDIDAAKFHGHVIDGYALMEPNPLSGDEASFCRQVNQERKESLKRACATIAKVDVEEPVMVGADPYGIDVRGRFDVIRLPFPERAETKDAAQKELDGIVPP
jgi:hypothetical protein